MQYRYVILVNIFLFFSVARSAKAFDYDDIYDSWEEDLIYKKRRLEKEIKECINAFDKATNARNK